MKTCGILALDPGTTSGVDCGTWVLGCDVTEAVTEWRGVSREVSGTILEQAQIICGMWLGLCSQLPDLKCYLVIESYQQRPVAHMLPSGALDPIRVAYMTLGLLAGLGCPECVIWQTAGVAMSHATDARLREWGSWIRGSGHKRDARRHALTLRNRLSE